MTAVRNFVRSNVRNPNAIAYFLMAVGALFFPAVVQFATGGSGDYLVGLAADGGIYMLMAIGLNVVVGFAGLLDLGYAAFFAIGSYTYALVASNHLGVTPIGHSLHVPFWIALFIGMFVAATARARSWARRRSDCGVTTWPSSRSASVRSCRVFSATPGSGPAASPESAHLTCPHCPDGCRDHGSARTSAGCPTSGSRRRTSPPTTC